MLDLRDLAAPIIGAPMAGGPSTPALVAAISDAGGLGYLAAGYRTPEALSQQIAETRALTGAPFGVNLFLVGPSFADAGRLTDYREVVRPEAERLGTAPGEPRWDDDGWQAKLDVVLDLAPAAVSFTFGCPPREVLDALAARDIHTTVTVTSVPEAVEAAAHGAASLAVQGDEAGGHRGTWDPLADPRGPALTDLVRAISAEVSVPVVAGGGVAGPAHVRALLERGANAVQVGTAFLLADEAGTNEVHRAALQDPAFTATALTRAYTGRWARGLANRFVAEHPDAPGGYPEIHHLTAPIRAAAVAAGDSQTAHLWAGTGFAAARPLGAAEIVASLVP